MKIRTLLIAGLCLLSCNLSLASEEDEWDAPPDQTEESTKSLSAADYVKAEKKWLKQYLKYSKQVLKTVSKIKSPKAADAAAKKINAIHLTKDGKPKTPRPDKPGGLDESELKLQDVELHDETTVRTFLPKKQLIQLYQNIDNITTIVDELPPECQTGDLSEAVSDFAAHATAY